MKVLAEYGRNQDSNITRLARHGGSAAGLRAVVPRRRDGRRQHARTALRRRRSATHERDARRGRPAHVEEIDTDALAWLWNSNVRATALVLDGFVRRGDDPRVRAAASCAGCSPRGENGRWSNTQENATALESLVGYYKKFEAEMPNMTATRRASGARRSAPRRSADARRPRSPCGSRCRTCVRQVAAGAERDLAISRAGTGRLYYSRAPAVRADRAAARARPGHARRAPLRAVRRERRTSPAATTFAAGDLIRVTLTITLPKERRYVAVTDALPAGVEAVDSWFRTTASDLAQGRLGAVRTTRPGRRAGAAAASITSRSTTTASRSSRRGSAEGRHEFSYLVRATTAGTFSVAGHAGRRDVRAGSERTRPAPVIDRDHGERAIGPWAIWAIEMRHS